MCLMDGRTDVTYVSFSLIKNISLTVCYDSCKNCKEKEVGTFENNLCISCKENFYYISGQDDEIIGFNCYNITDERVSNYYLDDGKFHSCNEACKTCKNSSMCFSCADNYYFKAYDNNTIIEGLCETDLSEKGYYLDTVNFKYNDITINHVYKKCYESCKSCIGKGTKENNNCNECNNPLIKYPFNNQQCLKDISNCESGIWTFKDNNIDCINFSQCDLNKKIIAFGINKGLCIENCQNFQSPYLPTSLSFVTLKNCENQNNFCIPHDKCTFENRLSINSNRLECSSTFENCCFNFSDPLTYVHDIDNIETIPKEAGDDKYNDISKRAKIWKMINKNVNYPYHNDFENPLIEEYKILYKNEKEKNNNTDIYLISTNIYNDFTINIYPLDIEDFVYNNILIPNNYGFVNFRELISPSFLEYEIENKVIILTILIESNCPNSAINDLNYFFSAFDESRLNHGEIKLSSSNAFEKNGNKLNVFYPLKNYKNSNTDLSKRNTEYLVENIKEMYQKNPDINLGNIDDPFYNDICVLFTSDFDTDMTLNDRRDEYFVSKSLCEDNCILKNIIDRDLKNIRASCTCEIKSDFISNQNGGQKDDIPQISSLNIGSFVCIKQAFNSQNISKNPIFWVLLLVIIFFVLMLLAFIFFGNNVLIKILKLENENLNASSNLNNFNNNKSSDIKYIENGEIKINEGSSKKEELINSKIDKIEGSLSRISKIEKQDSIQSNENINTIMNNNINKYDFSKTETDKKLNQNSGSNFYRNNNERIELNEIGKSSEKNNPPKKKNEKKNNNNTTRTNIDKDLISNDYSLSKNINININNDNSEISFDNISHEKPVYIDNLINKGEMLENNFLSFPMKYERNLIFQYYKKYFYINPELNTKDVNKLLYRCNTMEDDYSQKTKKNKRHKIKNKRNKKNMKVVQLLGGEDLLYQTDKKYDSDNFYEKDYIKNKFKSQESRDDSIFDNDKILIKSGTNNVLKNSRKIKKESDELIETSKIDSEFSGEKGKIFKHKKKRKNNFLQSLTRKEAEKNDISNYGKKEDYKNTRLKTDCDESGKYLIKSTLKLIGKEGIVNENNSSSYSNEKSYLSVYNEKNKNKIKLDKKLKSRKNNRMLKIRNEETVKSDKKSDKKSDSKSDKKINNKKKSSKNQIVINKQEEIKIKSIDDMEKDSKKKSNKEQINNKGISLSMSSSMDIIGDKVLLDENIYLFYWQYLKKRELFLVCFFDNKDSIPYFIRWSTFIFCLLVIFTLNCFFFVESNVHTRYINALEGGNSHYNINEFANAICVSLISIVIKMIIIKLLLNRVFKINKNVKKMMKHSYEKKLEESELDDLKQKRYNYLIIYQKKLMIFFIALFGASLFLSYICICYGAVFKNSLDYFFLGFLFSCIFSFLFCAVICIIIVGIGKLSRIYKKECLLSIYRGLNKVY